MTLEVGEHIPAEFADAFVEYLTSNGDLVIFTAAQPGQTGHGHINEQPKSYWLGKFQDCNFHLDEPALTRVAEHLRSSGAFPYLYSNLLIVRKDGAANR